LENLDYLKGILLIGLISALTSCNKENRLLEKKYVGLWMETSWTYEFRDNGQFIFKSEGHYGNVIDSGFYFIHDNLILLNPRTDWHAYDGALKTRLKIIDSNCIRDFNNNFYCVTVDIINPLNENEWTFQSRVIDIIDTLQVVNDEKQRVAKHYPDNEELEFKILYERIIVIDNREFHEFNLIRYDLKEGRQYYLTFLATKKPFEIFQHNSAGNKLSLIYKE
jgi:hypothetical protein